MHRFFFAVILSILSVQIASAQGYRNGSITIEGTINTCADAGSTDAYACSLSPAIAAYFTGGQYCFHANTINTGASSLELNGLGAKTIKKMTGAITSDLADGDIRAGQRVCVVYDGTNMQMQSQLGNIVASDLTCTNCIGPTEITDLTLGTDTAGNYVASVASGAGISGGAAGSEGAALTLALDLATLVASQTLWDSANATRTLTAGLSGATDPVITFADGVVNVSTGALQEGGNAVPNATDNLGFFAATSSSQMRTVLNDETGTGVALFNDPQAMTLNVESGTNAVTTVSKIIFDGASCVNSVATLNWDDDGSGGTEPTAACNDTGAITRPSANFSGSAVNTMERTIKLPSDWTGNIDLAIRYVTTTASPTGNVEWDISTVCRAVGESWDAAYNTAQVITDAVGAQNALNDATQATVTTTGCAAGEDLSLRISRDGTSDTNNDTALMLHAEITLRRAQ